MEGGQAHVAAAGGQYAARLSLAPAPADDVVLARYRPPPEAEGRAAGAEGEQPEVATQPRGEEAPVVGGGEDAAGTSAAAVRAGLASPRGGGGGVPRESDRWRWQLMTLELLPALETGRDPRLVPQAHSIWLRQHVQVGLGLRRPASSVVERHPPRLGCQLTRPSAPLPRSA